MMMMLMIIIEQSFVVMRVTKPILYLTSLVELHRELDSQNNFTLRFKITKFQQPSYVLSYFLLFSFSFFLEKQLTLPSISFILLSSFSFSYVPYYNLFNRSFDLGLLARLGVNNY